MDSTHSYEQIISSASLEERRTVALERIADYLEVLAADARCKQLSALGTELGPSLPRHPREPELDSELNKRRQDCSAALIKARASVTGLPCPWA